MTNASDPRTPRVLDAFRHGLRELGYVEGQNIAIESRWTEGGYDRLRDLATELVRFCASDSGCKASNSLARQGENLTGLSLMAPDLVGKQLEVDADRADPDAPAG